MKCAVRQLFCPPQASIEILWCKLAAHLRYDPSAIYILLIVIKTLLRLKKLIHLIVLQLQILKKYYWTQINI